MSPVTQIHVDRPAFCLSPAPFAADSLLISSQALSALNATAVSQNRSPSRDITPCNSAPPSPRANKFMMAIEAQQAKTFAKFASSVETFTITKALKEMRAESWRPSHKRGVSFEEVANLRKPLSRDQVENLPVFDDESDDEA